MKDLIKTALENPAEMESILNDGLCHAYRHSVMPAGCTPDHADIALEKSNGIYSFLIDFGVTTNVNNNNFRLFLTKGEVKFETFNELISFFRSVLELFDDDENEGEDDQQLAPSVQNNSSSQTDASAARNIASASNRINTVIGDTFNNLAAARNNTAARSTASSITRTTTAGRNHTRSDRQIFPQDITDKIKEKIYGQDEAIAILSEGIVNNHFILKKIYVAGIMGEPATGKTETCKLMADVLTDLTGRKYGLIRIDANTCGNDSSVASILGAPPGYAGYGKKTALDEIRRNPYQVVLIDEVDKANEQLLISLMGALDTGLLTLADNSAPIDMNKCIVLFTSNIHVDNEEYIEGSEWDRAELCKDAFTKHFGHKEISRRINDFVVFMPLSDDAQIDVISKFAKKAVAEYGATLVHIDENLMADFLTMKTQYGASEIANRVNRSIGRAITKARNYKLIENKSVALTGTPDDLRFEIIEEK